MVLSKHDVFLFKILFIYIKIEGKGGRKSGRETSKGERTSIDCLSYEPDSDREQVVNPGTCPGQESNWQPFTLWGDAQPTESGQRDVLGNV